MICKAGFLEPEIEKNILPPVIFMEIRKKCTILALQDCDILPLKRVVQISYNTVTKSNRAERTCRRLLFCTQKNGCD